VIPALRAFWTARYFMAVPMPWCRHGASTQVSMSKPKLPSGPMIDSGRPGGDLPQRDELNAGEQEALPVTRAR
jgi:hypothetical protein